MMENSSNTSTTSNNQLINLQTSLIANVFLAIFLIFLLIATVVGNIFVILAIRIDLHLRSPTHFFMCSLAIADLLLGTTVLPFSSYLLYFKHWPFGDIFCKIWLALDIVCCTASIYQVLAISIDRFIGVTRPLRYNMLLTKKRVHSIIICVWLLSLALSLIGIGWKSNNQNKNTCEINNNPGFALFSASISFYIPLFIILFLYFRIYKEARIQMKFLTTGVKTSKADNHGNGVMLRVHIGPTNKNKIICQCNSYTSPGNKHLRSNQFLKKNSYSISYKQRDSYRKQSTAHILNNIGNNININNSEDYLRRAMFVRNNNKTYLKSCSFDDAMRHSRASIESSRNVCQICSNLSSNSLVASKNFASNSNISFSSKLAKFKREQKAAKTLAIVVDSLKSQNLEKINHPILQSLNVIFFWLGYCNSAMNPLIYAFSSREFRRAYKGILQCNLKNRHKKELNKVLKVNFRFNPSDRMIPTFN